MAERCKFLFPLLRCYLRSDVRCAKKEKRVRAEKGITERKRVRTVVVYGGDAVGGSNENVESGRESDKTRDFRSNPQAFIHWSVSL
ncbi:hypothetical protein VNO80_01130 [Phaseolus coccineus]|uniref:Uncharacterized protein n=1 Tax=Phaseolus coccineus TaxID=3886 RepID=A0AAN9RR13_PHACN